MEFIFEPALQAYMRKTGKTRIVVEVAQANCSDFEIQELHLYFASEKQAAYLADKKNFHPKEAPVGQVLLPNYRLDYEKTVTFGLKSFLCFRQITQKGIRF